VTLWVLVSDVLGGYLLKRPLFNSINMAQILRTQQKQTSIGSHVDDWESLSPQERCGKWIRWAEYDWDYTEKKTVELTKYRISKCSNSKCENGLEWRRVRYRCHSREHADYEVVYKQNGKKKIVFPKGSCAESRYTRARRLIESHYGKYPDMRYSVFTKTPTAIKSRKDVGYWTLQLYRTLTKFNKWGVMRNVMCVIDILKNPDGTYNLHFNVVWVGSFISKADLEREWGKVGGGYVWVNRRSGKKAMEFTIHYMALRTAVMNEPAKRPKINIGTHEFKTKFKGLRFLRTWFWDKGLKKYVKNCFLAWLEFYSHHCKICGSKLLFYDVTLEEYLKMSKPPPEPYLNSSIWSFVNDRREEFYLETVSWVALKKGSVFCERENVWKTQWEDHWVFTEEVVFV